MKAFQKKSSVSSGPVSFRAALKKDLKKNSFAYLLIVPVLLWYLVFCYAPMWGILLSFKDYKPLLGFAGSKWVGLKHFQNFLSGPYFFRTIKNTLMGTGFRLHLADPSGVAAQRSQVHEV